ncbi:MAG: hypothetical protein RL701_1724 [Pseudomonadota bacterium]
MSWKLMQMQARSSWLVGVGVLSLLSVSVGACGTEALPAPADARSAQTAPAPNAQVIEIPLTPALELLPRERVASGLANPRGLHVSQDGSLIVAVAGTGDPAQPLTGGILQLRDANHDGDFDDAGEQRTLLDRQPSRNLFDLVRRDEVFGMSGMAEGGGELLVALANFGGPSKLFRIDGETVTPWGNTSGNVNDLAYDARRKTWVGVASTSDEIVELHAGGRSQRIAKFAPLASGQDAVPAYLQYDPLSGDVLVSLFSGSPEGEEGGKGVEIVARSASIVRVHAETHSATPFVVGLTVPTDLALDDHGYVYVLEFCADFVDPIETREQMSAGTLHGGFRRFSGRLLRIQRETHAVAVVAQGLDAPTNLTLAGGYLYIAQGMGTPGRSIPGPDGAPRALTGFIERIKLP